MHPRRSKTLEENENVSVHCPPEFMSLPSPPPEPSATGPQLERVVHFRPDPLDTVPKDPALLPNGNIPNTPLAVVTIAFALGIKSFQRVDLAIPPPHHLLAFPFHEPRGFRLVHAHEANVLWFSAAREEIIGYYVLC